MRIWLITLWALAVISAVMCVVLLSKPADAQTACVPLADLLAALRDKYGEYVVATAETPGGQMFITAAKHGAFTVVIANRGIGCIVITGESFQSDRGI
ncbi:hypothetical protein MesoLjLc_50380 [Mesorhizobium sp. L-8-10]|uniref:hypothetical protein n=1 Tax=Mesorhizobium sp. L-8-10 TaxID=2744523 RepID=UPI0019263B8D|nr:hypothetical protein [Mesorhizobium sp. L-8-10]BCH33108.1 hypothetical protein MesoLjLc_50380 [Mesorhizobium sp. L-8-10]